MKNKNFKFSNTGNAFLVAFATFYVLSLIYEFSFRFTSGMSGAAAWCQYLINPVAFIGSMLVYAKRKNVDVVSATKLDKKIGLKQIGILSLLSVCCIMAFLPVSYIFLDILQRIGFDNGGINIPDTTVSAGAYFLGVLLLAVFPAFAEEFLMRGVVLNAASRKRDYSYAILITAGMFSLMHGNAYQTVHQFLLGAVLAYVVLVSKSLWAGIFLHFFNNFLSLTLEIPYQAYESYLEQVPAWAWYLIWIVAILLGGTLVVYLLKKFTKVSAPKRVEILPDNAEVIDVYENKDGVYSTEKTLSVKAKESKNDFAAAFRDLCGIFKKGGLKAAYNKINTIIRDITPEDDEMTEMSREDFFPSNIKLVYIILAVIWIISLVSGFLN